MQSERRRIKQPHMSVENEVTIYGCWDNDSQLRVIPRVVIAHHFFEWRGYKFAVTPAQPLREKGLWTATDCATGLRFGKVEKDASECEQRARQILEVNGIEKYLIAVKKMKMIITREISEMKKL